MVKERRSAVGPILLTTLLICLFPLSYVLSIGPASRLVSREQLSVKVYEVTYAPLFWCRSRSKAFEWFLEGYVHLWL
jgi:hypothetical protein